ncbi:MAG: cupin domain-containing protein [Candidatus Aminicenantes bacterium]|nr:cupin domain-containing protein [Candidatus Aminicenantes bacterium]
MFYKKNNSGYKTLSGGIQYKTLVHGFDTSMHEFKIEKGSIIPVHSHPHEQTGYLVAGRLIFVFKDKTMGAESGDSWNIPGGEAHGVQAIEDCVVIEVFSPTRKEYLS